MAGACTTRPKLSRLDSLMPMPTPTRLRTLSLCALLALEPLVFRAGQTTAQILSKSAVNRGAE
jgi:hypothetical protein